MSVARAQREIDSREFAEWMAYSIIEPFGPEREDQRAGMVAALIANVYRDSKKKSDPYTVEDFFPRYSDTRQAPDGPPPEMLEQKIFQWAATMNAANSRKPMKRQKKPKG